MIKILFLAGLLSISTYANMTSELYFELELKAQEMTIQGQNERLQCMQNSCPMSAQYKIDGDYQTKIFQVYQEQGTTPSKVAAYYTHNYKKIDTYLKENESLKNKMDELSQTFEEISQQIRTLVEAQ
ncbi:MAG: hypothetical protein DRH06_07335 [Deltaproteobacteria bacterium]|nr:MAG: hypothetical protein DRH06_07335 [Deltaproteobacteria bacterium]